MDKTTKITRGPWATLEISSNKLDFTWTLYHNVFSLFRYYRYYLHLEGTLHLNPIYPRMLCAKFGWNWLCGSGEEDCLIASMYVRYFVIISPWKRAQLFIWINSNYLHFGMLCANFGLNWPSGSGEDVKKCEKFTTTTTTTDNGQILSRKANLRLWIRWTKKMKKLTKEFTIVILEGGVRFLSPFPCQKV